MQARPRGGVEIASRARSADRPEGRVDLTAGAVPELPRRAAVLQRLAGERFDLLVIGGGAAGTGLAAAAAERGLRTALLERDDFAAGTSSRSTKLLHGGVRYLERAVRRFDPDEFRLVREGLSERAAVMRQAPHLTRRLAILTPCPDPASLGYFAAGLRLYDLLAGRRGLGGTRVLGPHAARAAFPTLGSRPLAGAVTYTDGQFDDARLCVALAVTAAEAGAAVANHAAVGSLTFEAGRVAGAVAEDRIGGARIHVRAAAVVNAAGPFAEEVARLDPGSGGAPRLRVSAGVHLVLRGGLCPPDTGLLVPRTSDGRVLFVLPWLGRTLVGTTDADAEPSAHPAVSARDVSYLLEHVGRHLTVPLGPGDVLSAWCGLRPLLRATGRGATADLSRRHAVVVAPSGLITLVGGKWTTYRRMAADALAAVDPRLRLTAAPEGPIAGGGAPEPGMRHRPGLPEDVAGHLQQSYGDRAPAVAALCTGAGERLAPGFPSVAADVLWAVRREMALRPLDVLARRTRLAFLDRAAARAALPRVAALMAAELGWDAARTAGEEAAAREVLEGDL